MNICAYCKQDGKMTREHVIPSFLYNFQKNLSKTVLGWNEVAGKMVGGEAKVKDVCEKCNNVILCDLDAKGKKLLDSAGIMTSNFTAKSIDLIYSFDDLTRWIFKISYNSTRTDGAHRHIFEPHIPYILEGINKIHRSEIAILAFMAAPVVLDGNNRESELFSKVAAGAKTFNPFLVRISYGEAIGAKSYQLRTVGFGPLVFLMMVFDGEVSPGHAAASIRDMIKKNPGTIELTRGSKFVHLKPGNRTWLDLYQPQIMRVIRANKLKQSLT